MQEKATEPSLQYDQGVSYKNCKQAVFGQPYKKVLMVLILR